MPVAVDRAAVMSELEQLSGQWHAAARRGVRPAAPAPLGPDDHTRGDGSLEVIEYAHYLSPEVVDVREDLASARTVLADRVCFSFRHFVLPTSELELAVRAAEAAEAAAAQGRFWDMHLRLLTRDAEWDDRKLHAHARALGLDIDAFDADMASGAHLPHIVSDVHSGLEAGVDGEPTFFIGSERVDGGYDEAEMLAALARALDDPSVPAALVAGRTR